MTQRLWFSIKNAWKRGYQPKKVWYAGLHPMSSPYGLSPRGRLQSCTSLLRASQRTWGGFVCPLPGLGHRLSQCGLAQQGQYPENIKELQYNNLLGNVWNSIFEKQWETFGLCMEELLFISRAWRAQDPAKLLPLARIATYWHIVRCWHPKGYLPEGNKDHCFDEHELDTRAILLK